MIVEKTVFVFDICSSTVMMEDVQLTSSLDSYSSMMNDFKNFLVKMQKSFSFEIYKFLGDGFILIFNSSVLIEQIYQFSEELVDIGGKIINLFIQDHLQKKNLPRVGITIGVDAGTLDHKNEEYVGRAINIACRLQGKLDLTDSVNRIIISQKVYGMINDPIVKAKFENKPKKLKNVNDGKEVPCYESSPLVRKSKGKTAPSSKQQGSRYISSAPSILETIKNNNDKTYLIRIKRSDGTIVYSTKKATDKKNKGYKIIKN